MAENVDKSIEKKGILLSRNTPVALVVGAAGFLGSNLVSELLRKNIQVVGVDDFSTGKSENLEEAIKNRNFHLINKKAQSFDIDTPRIDYVFILAGSRWSLGNVLNLAKKYNTKLVFVSWIDLYDKDNDYSWYKVAESEIANFAKENKLNARVLRLSAIFGPRMNFDSKDPTVRLIYYAATGDIQKETSVLDFSSRALFVDDAIDLIIKSMMTGATAQRIFDGARLIPVKVSEIKQVLIDPSWYAERSFVPSDLPPWPTPNLEKTIKYLSWKPKNNLVDGLKITLNYFKENEIEVNETQDKVQNNYKEQAERNFREIQKDSTEQVTSTNRKITDDLKKVIKEDRPKKPSPKIPFHKIFIGGLVLLIFYALIWPLLMAIYQTYSFKNNLSQTRNYLEKGDFDHSLSSANNAKADVAGLTDFVLGFSYISNNGLFKDQIDSVNETLTLMGQVADATEKSVVGTKALYQGMKAVTGELTASPKDYFAKAEVNFAKADEELSSTQAILSRDKLDDRLPGFLKIGFNSLDNKLSSGLDLVRKGRAVASILPQVTAVSGKKNYLVLLQNNNELRPTGGFIGSFANISFEGGKLKKLEVNDIYNIDGKLPFHVEPPKEIVEDLNQKDWYLRDSNWEPDFPTAARQAEWFYTKETGDRVDGVVALDLSTIGALLTANGPIDVTDYNEQVSADNLFEKSIAHSEQGFFPGSQAKKNFLTALTNQLFNKLFFLPNQNWPGVVSSLGKSLDQKHLMVYLDDPHLFSYMASQNWAGALPRPGTQGVVGQLEDFLATVDANLGANKSNYYLKRNFNLTTTIGKEGEINHRLKINYVNASPGDVWPAGTYKNRLRVYVPFGAKLIRVLVGKEDMTSKVTSFADYGRSGFSLLVEVLPKQSQDVVLDYQLSGRLEFKNSTATYVLNVIKQAGTNQDPFNWQLNYPINYQIVSGQGSNNGPQEHDVSTDLSTDRSFEVTFKK